MNRDEHERIDTTPELRDAKDEALWKLLGVVDDVEASPELRRKVLARLNEAPQGRVLRFPWRVAAVAAAVILLVFAGQFMMSDGDGGGQQTPIAPVDSAALARSLNEIDELDLIALDVDELESIQDDWFGG